MSIILEDLKDLMTHFSTTQSDFLTENCIVALETIPHKSGCQLEISGLCEDKVILSWSKKIIKSGYREEIKFTEKGAEALSFFLAMRYTGYEIMYEAAIGEGVDYWLGYSENHENYDGKNFLKGRLEISGILRETKSNTLSSRILQKKKQTDRSKSSGVPAFVSIIEFSKLKAHIDKK